MDNKYDLNLIHSNLLDIFKEFKQICDKHHIPYVLAYGSLLGAVRHEGFIPWDDDLDVAMLREDYNKFLSIATKEVTKDSLIYIQNYKTDEFFPHVFTRIGLKNSLAVQNSWKHAKFNMPLFIDVFVYDRIPSNQFLFKLQTKIIRFLMNIKRFKSGVFLTVDPKEVSNSKIKKKLLKFIQQVPFSHNIIPMSFLNKIHDKVQQWGNKDSRFKEAAYSNFYTGGEIGIRESQCFKEDFTDVQIVNFESELVPIPKSYDRILQRLYGNYMEYPPVEDRRGNHNFIHLEF